MNLIAMLTFNFVLMKYNMTTQEEKGLQIQTMSGFQREVRKVRKKPITPTYSLFEKNGMFSHIELPMNGKDRIPNEFLEYIFGEDYKKHYKINMKSLKEYLNHLYFTRPRV